MAVLIVSRHMHELHGAIAIVCVPCARGRQLCDKLLLMREYGGGYMLHR